MNEEIKRTYESLPEEEKEQLQKYQNPQPKNPRPTLHHPPSITC